MKTQVSETSKKVPLFEFKKNVVLSHDGETVGFLADMYSDWYGNAKYFTLDSETYSDQNLYPLEFIKNVEGSVITLCRDFQDIRGSKFYSLEKVLDRDPYLTCDRIAC